MQIQATDSKGTKTYRLKGLLHRIDGPAVEHASGDKYWYLNGRLHRLDGPAVEFADRRILWFLEGFECSFDEWLYKVKISDEEKTLLVLKYK